MTYLADDTDSSGAPATSERAGSRRALGCAFEVVETARGLIPAIGQLLSGRRFQFEEQHLPHALYRRWR